MWLFARKKMFDEFYSEEPDDSYGYKRLSAACILQATRDFFSADDDVRKHAADWIMSDGFDYCCSLVGINPLMVRRKVVAGDLMMEPRIYPATIDER
jgi:hypothetical protein